MKRPLVWNWPAVALGLAVLLALVWGWRRWQPVAVPVATVAESALNRTLQFSGRVASASRVDVGATVTGRIVAVLVTEGQPVQSGQVLVRLDDSEARAALSQARATLQQSQARQAGIQGSGLRALQAGVVQAQAQLTAARAEYRRVSDLVQRGFVSAARLDEVQRGVDVAQAQLAQAQAQTGAAGDSGSETAQARAQVAAAQAAVEVAAARLAQMTLTAPAAGRVLQRQAEPGQIVQPGRALLSLALQGPIELVAPVDERFLDELQAGQPARVAADAWPDRPFNARVASIAPRVDAQRGSVEVKLQLEPPVPPFLREDMSLSIEVRTGARERTLVVPADALRDEARKVLVLRDGRVAEQVVSVGLRSLLQAEITQGLARGDQVVVGPAWPVGTRARANEGSAAPSKAAGAQSADDTGRTLGSAMGR